MGNACSLPPDAHGCASTLLSTYDNLTIVTTYEFLWSRTLWRDSFVFSVMWKSRQFIEQVLVVVVIVVAVVVVMMMVNLPAEPLSLFAGVTDELLIGATLFSSCAAWF